MSNGEATPLINNRGDGDSSFDSASRYGGPTTTDIRGMTVTHNKEHLIE